MTLQEFVHEHRHADVKSLALKMRQYPELDAAFALQQIEGWQKAEHKLPEIAAIDGWLWPKRLSVEQCSSQSTALYKQQVLGKRPIKGELVDLTGGMGVDTFYLSELFEEVHYVEQQEELCRLAERNFALAGKNVAVHCCRAEQWLELSANGANERTIFVDPGRRDAHGGKVFKLQDCEPDVVSLLSILRACARRILLKLSPMLDITEAVRALGGATEVHVVAVKHEVKELLVLLDERRDSLDPEITCVNLETEEETFVFRRSEEVNRNDGANRANTTYKTNKTEEANKTLEAAEEWILVEPNGAIQKSGAFRLFGGKYGLTQLDANSHLYCLPTAGSCMQESTETFRESDTNFRETVGSCMQDGIEAVAKKYIHFCENEGPENSECPEKKDIKTGIPGRIFRVHIATKEELKAIKQANVICRNYPLSADALKKKLKVRDGGEKYVIATKIASKPTIFLGCRQFLHI